MPDALTAVVIGLGNVGKFHAQAYEEMGLKVIPADKHNWKLRVLEGDIISVCSYDEAHAEQVIYSLEKQKHVMCEKPLCLTKQELSDIKSVVNGLCLAQNFPLRHHHEFIRAKMENHGDIYRIEASYNYGRPPKDWWPPDYSIVLGGMIHMIDIVQWITGMKILLIGQTGNSVIRTVLAQIGFDIPVVFSADFGRGVGMHEHYLRIHGTKHHTIIENHKSTDKKACVKEFVRNVQFGKCRHDFSAIETALEIEGL